MPKRSKENQSRVWIELEAHNDDAVNVARAEMATAMLRRLSDHPAGERGPEFFWNETKQCYCIADASGAYQECADNGHWFNLGFYGRPI